jgi:hypothetical protein
LGLADIQMPGRRPQTAFIGDGKQMADLGEFHGDAIVVSPASFCHLF